MHPANEHQCPMCRHATIAIWRALCLRCHAMLPPNTRPQIVYAYQHRVLNPEAWQRATTWAQRWYLGRNIPGNNEEGPQ